MAKVIEPPRLLGVAGGLVILLFTSCASRQAQDGASRPGPEEKRMEVWVGDWKTKLVGYGSPLGPAGTFVGEQRMRMISNGFVLENKGWDTAGYQGSEIMRYDRVSKNYKIGPGENDGGPVVGMSGVAVVEKNTWSKTFTLPHTNGVTYITRGADTLSSDAKSATVKYEVSPDGGKTWMMYFDGTLVRIEGARDGKKSGNR